MANNPITGQDYQLQWTDFVAQPPRNRGNSVAFTSAQSSVSFAIRTGEEVLGWGRPRGASSLGFQVDNLTIRVSPERGRMWSVKSAQTADVLAHEQGHYSIVGQVMWDLWFDLMSTPQIFTSEGPARAWANGLVRDATNLINKLESNGRDGVYDTQTNHGLNSTVQDQWNRAFVLASPPTGMRFTEALKAQGISF